MLNIGKGTQCQLHTAMHRYTWPHTDHCGHTQSHTSIHCLMWPHTGMCKHGDTCPAHPATRRLPYPQPLPQNPATPSHSCSGYPQAVTTLQRPRHTSSAVSTQACRFRQTPPQAANVSEACQLVLGGCGCEDAPPELTCPGQGGGVLLSQRTTSQPWKEELGLLPSIANGP